jgi:hypothetical protein
MSDESFYDWLLKLSEKKDFIDVMNFSKKSLETKDDMEFILRYFCVKSYNKDVDKFSDVKTFLDKKTISIIEDE